MTTIAGYTTTQVGQMLGRSTNTIRAMVARGDLDDIGVRADGTTKHNYVITPKSVAEFKARMKTGSNGHGRMRAPSPLPRTITPADPTPEPPPLEPSQGREPIELRPLRPLIHFVERIAKVEARLGIMEGRFLDLEGDVASVLQFCVPPEPADD
jgi:hypothetical protein